MLQSAEKRPEFWRETHKVLWLLIGSLTREETSFAILIERIIFFHVCKTLARTHLRKKILSEYISVYV